MQKVFDRPFFKKVVGTWGNAPERVPPSADGVPLAVQKTQERVNFAPHGAKEGKPTEMGFSLRDTQGNILSKPRRFAATLISRVPRQLPLGGSL